MEPSNGNEFNKDDRVWIILYEGGIRGFIDNLQDYNEDLSK